MSEIKKRVNKKYSQFITCSNCNNTNMNNVIEILFSYIKLNLCTECVKELTKVLSETGNNNCQKCGSNKLNVKFYESFNYLCLECYKEEITIEPKNFHGFTNNTGDERF